MTQYEKAAQTRKEHKQLRDEKERTKRMMIERTKRALYEVLEDPESTKEQRYNAAIRLYDMLKGF